VLVTFSPKRRQAQLEETSGFGRSQPRRGHEEVEGQREPDRLSAPPGRGRAAVPSVCRQMGVSEATFYIWKKKYAHLGVSA
jgi:hypothetical protein